MRSIQQTTKAQRTVRPQRGADLLRLVLAILLLPACAWAGDVGGYSSSLASTSTRSATVPPSSYESGLVTRPNPIDSSGNLVVTGNVGAGKHFRGGVPYRSGTSLSAPLGSRSLDSFLRYTAPNDPMVSSPGTYSPYYSASGTAATMPPGTRSVLSPGLSGLGTTPAQRPADTTGSTVYPNSSFRILAGDSAEMPTDSAASSTAPRLQLWSPTGASETAIDRNPFDRSLSPRTPSDNRMGLTGAADSGSAQGTGPYQWQSRVQPDALGVQTQSSQSSLESKRTTPSGTETVTNEVYRQEMEALQRRLVEVKTEVAQLEQSLASRQEASPSDSDVAQFDASGSSFPSSGFGMGVQSQAPTADPQAESPSASRREELLQETARLLSRTRAGTSLTLPAVPPTTTALGKTGETTSKAETDTTPRLQLYNPNRMYPSTGLKPALPTTKPVAESSSSPLGLRTPNPPSAVRNPQSIPPDTPVVQTTVQSPVRPAEPDPSATSMREFARHIQLAERYLRNREYTRAAETFALATAYRPTDSHAHLGRSQALLAAGQLDDSAMSLAKAIELDPERVLEKVDLIDTVGGPDAFIARFNELDEALQTSDAPMLHLLMAYICLQMDRPEEAQVALDTAQRLLPSSRPISLLKAAVGLP